jgi:hypothetical protein
MAVKVTNFTNGVVPASFWTPLSGMTLMTTQGFDTLAQGQGQSLF